MVTDSSYFQLTSPATAANRNAVTELAPQSQELAPMEDRSPETEVPGDQPYDSEYSNNF